MSEKNRLQTDTKSSRSAAISVIIPVYNVAPYIGDCIQSLKAQTFTDLEFIFVDDASTDNSLEIIEAFAKEDSRVLIFRNDERRYAGYSRNRGIDMARGEFLSFIDPDDRISDDFYELLYQAAKAESADIAKGNGINIKTDGSKARKMMDLNQEIRKGMALNKPLYTLFISDHWSGLYRHELFQNPDVRYGSTRRSEDTFFLLAVCTYTNNITICDEALYYYCQRPDSAVHTIDHISLTDQSKAFDDLMCFLSSHHETDNHSQDYVIKQANKRLKVFYSIKKGFKYDPDEIAFLDSIMETLRRFPCVDELKRKSLPIRVLMDCQICLPKTINMSPWDQFDPAAYLRLLFDWLRFLAAHPDYIGDFIKMMTKSFSNLLKRVTA